MPLLSRRRLALYVHTPCEAPSSTRAVRRFSLSSSLRCLPPNPLRLADAKGSDAEARRTIAETMDLVEYEFDDDDERVVATASLAGVRAADTPSSRAQVLKKAARS